MHVKRLILEAARYLGLSRLAAAATGKQLRILCYHGLWVTPGFQFGDRAFISPEQFADRMRRLKRSGRPVLPLGEAVERLADGSLPPGAVVVTIDDGWVSTFTHMLPILESLRLPATLYATTWYAGRALPVVNVAIAYLCAAASRKDIAVRAMIEKIDALPVDDRLDALRRFGAELGVAENWLETRQFNIMSVDQLAQAHRRGVDIQLHTHRHIDVATQLGELAQEIAENRNFLRQAIAGLSAEHFCYPGGGSQPDARAVLAEAGVVSATLVSQGLNAPGSDPYFLRRFLDGRSVSAAEFDAYLSGTLHYCDLARALLPDRPRNRIASLAD